MSNRINNSVVGTIAGVVGAAVFAASAIAGNITHDRLVNSENEPENWINHHGNYEAHRFSGLREINRDNVGDLKVAFTYAMGSTQGGGTDPVVFPFSGLEGTPTAEDGFLYLTTGWGVVTKIDVRGGKAVTVWKSDPEADKDWGTSVLCCGINNRGAVLARDMVIAPVLDGRIRALNKTDGSLIWESQVADPGIAETITGAPLVIRDTVVTGMAGAEFGVRGWFAALSLDDGKEIWRTHTIPGEGEPGNETWKDDFGAWKTGGGSTWVTGSYDPELDIIVWGTANPGPDWDNAYRPGDNLWTDSTIAVNATTGKFLWGFQHTPNDPYDYDSIAENTFVDTVINGQFVRSTLHANRNGFAYALDRATGEYVWGTQFVKKLDWTDGLDENGRPASYDPNSDVQSYNEGSAAHRGDLVEVGARSEIEGISCPAHTGGKNWPPTAYSPHTGLYYIPVIESCNKAFASVAPENWNAADRKWFLGGAPYFTFEDPRSGRITGSVTAIDVSNGVVVRKWETEFPMLGGVLATAGGLVFTGTADGAVVALDDTTLEELWRFETGSSINAPPMSYAAAGTQYIAIEVGLGGAWPQWWSDSTPEFNAAVPSNGLYVFSM
jgi:alcohol dehydrogenase (cytochrome c)